MSWTISPGAVGRTSESAAASGKLTFVDGDVRDAKLVREIMEGIDIVFHEAAIRITQCAEDPRLAHDVLATGTFNVLEAAVAAQVKRIVYASSASIYGQAEEFPTTEAIMATAIERSTERSSCTVRDCFEAFTKCMVWTMWPCGISTSMVREWTHLASIPK